jgi:putative DNA-invertase from lambdoid prophage Rac
MRIVRRGLSPSVCGIRVRLAERTRAGLERVRREGKKLGRPAAKVDAAIIRRMREEGASWSEIARRTRLSRGTVQKLWFNLER